MARSHDFRIHVLFLLKSKGCTSVGKARIPYAKYLGGLTLAIINATSAGAGEISLQCAPLVTTGAVSRDPVTKIEIVISGANWQIVHITKSGIQYWRERQYILRDHSSEQNRNWSGTLISHPNLNMFGRLDVHNEKYEYVETIYDTKRGAMVGMVRSVCAANAVNASSLTASPSSSLAAPESAAPPSITVQMELQGGTYTVPVQINGAITLKFLVDSGASDVAIPADVASTLLRTGTLTSDDFIGNQQYTLADGRTIPSMTFRIRSLRIGTRTIENINVSISPVEGNLLLGESFLRRLHSWTIDNANQTIILN